MSKDGSLPPGVTTRDIDEAFGEPRRRRDEPKYLRCIGCMLDFPADELDNECLCPTCRKNEDNHAAVDR